MSLSNDLKFLRNAQQLSIEDVHKISKLAVYIIQAIEDGSLFEDNEKNLTYQRSYVRTYAKVLKLNDDDVVKALDEHYSGVYNGKLLADYEKLRGAVPAKKSNENSSDAQSIEPKTETVQEVEKKEEQPLPKQTQAEIAEPTPVAKPEKPAPSTPKPRKVIPEIVGDTPVTSGFDPRTYNKTKATPEVGSVNWATLQPDNHIKKSMSLRPLIFGIVAVILLGGTGYGIYYWVNLPEKPKAPIKTITEVEKVVVNPNVTKPAETTPSTEITQMTDSSNSVIPIEPGQENLISSNSILPSVSENLVLPDTLSILVFAANDKLEPVRIKTDLTNSYFPYWIEKNSAMRFYFTDEIFIKGQYDRMMIMLNEKIHLVDFKNYRAPGREIHITRSVLEQFKQAYLNPVQVEQQQNLPFPKTITDRPVF